MEYSLRKAKRLGVLGGSILKCGHHVQALNSTNQYLVDLWKFMDVYVQIREEARGLYMLIFDG